MKTLKLKTTANKALRKLKQLSFILLLLACYTHASAQIQFCKEDGAATATFPQTCSETATDPNTEIELAMTDGVAYNHFFKTTLKVTKLEIYKDGALAHTLDANHLTWQQPSGAQVFFSLQNGVVNFQIANPQIATANDISLDLKFTHDGGGTDVSDTHQKFKLKVTSARNPIDLIFLLDISGSMNWGTETNDPCDLPTCTKRFDVLKSAVNQFLVDWSLANTNIDDKFGAAYFNSGYDANFNTLSAVTDPETQFPLIQINANSIQALKNQINAKTPSGWTAMGGGLQTVLEKITAAPNANRKRVIILFTDGDQNRSPMVNAANAMSVFTEDQTQVTSDHTEHPWQDGWVDTDHEALPFAINAGRNTKIYVIGTGATMATFDVLQKISEASGLTTTSQFGYNFHTLPAVFTNDFVNILKGNSPQLIDYRMHTLTGTNATESFEVNKNLEKVLLTCNWKANEPVTAKVIKDGVDVTDKATTVITDDSYIKFFYKFPFADNSISSGGQWDLVIEGKPKYEYGAYVLVDDHPFTYSTAFGSDDNETGDTLNLSVSLHLDAAAIETATVKAIILKPSQDIGTLLSKAIVKNKDFKPEPGSSPAQAKFQQLISDPEFSKLLVPEEQQVTLSYTGDGKYTAQFMNTDEAGVYQVIYSIHYADKNAGNFDRAEMKSAIIKFGKPDFKNSAVTKTVSSKQTTLTFYPKNKYGNYLGPDYANAIKVKLSIGKVSSYKDNLDGSYTYFITGVPQNTDPDISITIMEDTFYSGKLSKLDGSSSATINYWLLGLIISVSALVIYMFARKRK